MCKPIFLFAAVAFATYLSLSPGCVDNKDAREARDAARHRREAYKAYPPQPDLRGDEKFRVVYTMEASPHKKLIEKYRLDKYYADYLKVEVKAYKISLKDQVFYGSCFKRNAADDVSFHDAINDVDMRLIGGNLGTISVEEVKVGFPAIHPDDKDMVSRWSAWRIKVAAWKEVYKVSERLMWEPYYPADE